MQKLKRKLAACFHGIAIYSYASRDWNNCPAASRGLTMKTQASP